MGDTRGKEIDVEIQSLAPGGDAVGPQSDPPSAPGPTDGRVTFVALAAPGERVRARLEREKGRVAWAELVAVQRPGAVRVAAPCPLFGACGGCQWQHVSADAQRDAKKAIVERALAVAIGPVVAASPPFGYRDRAKLVRGAEQGTTTFGFRARRSHAVVDVPACPLFGPELARALPALRTAAGAWPPGTEVDVAAGAGGVHVNVNVEPRAAGAVDVGAARASLAAAGVVGLSVNGKPAWGEPAVDVAEPGGAPLPIPAGGFAQVGRAANAALVAAVMDAVGDAPGVVVELYAGSGNFTRHLLARAVTVHASDADAAAVERGRTNAPGAHWTVARAGSWSGFGAGSGQVPTGTVPTDPDTVVLDPPREGADAGALAVARRARQRIVYVSCDPQTLARDVRALAAAGFRVRHAVALDLMPQTFHVEVVALLDRG